MATDRNLRAKLTADQRAEFTETFNELDADGSGAIDTAEVKSGLQLCGMRPTDQDCAELVARFDINGDGELELFEWLELAAIVFLGKDDQEVPMEMFSHLSDDAMGSITKKSLFSAASRLFARVGRDDFSAADAEAMISAVSSSGEASSQDFLDLCLTMGFYKPAID